MYRGDNINTPPLGLTPTENIWRILENNLTPRKKLRAKRAKNFELFWRFYKGKSSKNGPKKTGKYDNPEPNILGNLENNLTPREKIWDFIVKGGGINIIRPVIVPKYSLNFEVLY